MRHRQVSEKNSFYLEGKSMNINYYWKYPQQEDEAHPNFLFRELSRDVIRLEVQYKYPKLYPLAKEIRNNSKYHVSLDNPSFETLYQAFASGEIHSPSRCNLIRRSFRSC